MPKLKLEYCNPFPADGPGWYAGEMPDGRRVHAMPMACSLSQIHWAGSVEDPDWCDCNKTEGRCTFCRIRDDGDVVFTKVTGCYRSSNGAVRALQHWAANPDGPPPPARWQCAWTAMKSPRCEGAPNAPTLPLSSTDRPMLPQGNAPYDGYDCDPRDSYREIMMDQITEETLDQCSELGHPRQAWLILTERQENAVTCTICGQTPNFWEKMSGDGSVLEFDFISEILDETHMASHEVIMDIDGDGIVFAFQSDSFEYAKEWPQAGSDDLTRLPYPGDDAITLRWFRDEWNQREEKPLGEDEVLLDPNTGEPLTDDTLREYITECHDEGFSYESSATDIVNVARDIDDDAEHEH